MSISLTPMEQKVLDCLDNQKLSVEDTAKTLHMESMRVVQIERKARRKIVKNESGSSYENNIEKGIDMRHKILNIHGYRGTAHNTAYKILDELYPTQIVSPQFDYDRTAPNDIISILDRHIKSENIGAIVGTSLGGFFACCAGRKYGIPIILINPCLLPFISLRQISETYSFARYGKQLFELFGQNMGELDKRYLSTIIGKSDEVINHNTTTEYLAKSKRWYEIEGGHSIERTDELSDAFREIFTYYDERLSKIQESETITDI